MPRFFLTFFGTNPNLTPLLRELFQWAATVYTSRSFTSLWLTSDAAEHSSIDPGQATNDGMHDLDKSVHQSKLGSWCSFFDYQLSLQQFSFSYRHVSLKFLLFKFSMGIELICLSIRRIFIA